MGQRLIVLPFSIGLRAARLGLRAARLPLDVISGLTGRGGEPDGQDFAPPPAPPQPAASPPPATVRVPAEEPVSATAVDGGPVAADEAEHVSEEPEFVAESTDPGAEEGAHAEIDVAEPWEGYARMTARDIEQRLATATAEEIAVVRLYESTHKRRQSVLRATERRMTQRAAERRRPR